MGRQCAFCQIAAKEQPAEIVLETEYSCAFLDISPIAPGQILVVPKQHHYASGTLTDAELADLYRTANRLGVALMREADCDGYNLIYAMGSCAGQTLNHLSVQVIPRRGDDGIIMPWFKTEDFASQEERRVFAEALRQRLTKAEEPIVDEEADEDDEI